MLTATDVRLRQNILVKKIAAINEDYDRRTLDEIKYEFRESKYMINMTVGQFVGLRREIVDMEENLKHILMPYKESVALRERFDRMDKFFEKCLAERKRNKHD